LIRYSGYAEDNLIALFCVYRCYQQGIVPSAVLCTECQVKVKTGLVSLKKHFLTFTSFLILRVFHPYTLCLFALIFFA